LFDDRVGNVAGWIGDDTGFLQFVFEAGDYAGCVPRGVDGGCAYCVAGWGVAGEELVS